MRWHVSVNVSTRLRVRTGPATSYRIVDYKYNGQTGIVVDCKTSGGMTWYKWEGTNYWSCGVENGKKYLNLIYDLGEKPPAQDPPKPKPEPDYDITINPINPVVDGVRDGKDNSKTLYVGSPWDKPVFFTENAPYDVQSDSVIAKNIAAIKNNMDIGYSASSDVYNGYLLNSSKGYLSDLQKKLYNSFNRNKVAFPDKELPKTFAYVFFTRPDLNILTRSSGSTNFSLTSQMDRDKKYQYLWENNPWCLKSLVLSGNPYHKFMVLLSNEALSFEVGDVALKTIEHGETYNGNKIIYGHSDQEANAAGEMSIRYIDTINLDVFKLHLAWTDYISKVSRGVFEPKRTYMKERILDYAVSCYYFLCGPDGNTILYWQKLTGVFPINTSENTFSWDSGTLLAKPEINIKYAYSFKSSMDMLTIHEFNELSSTSITGKPILDKYNIQTGSTMTHAPHVFYTKDTEGQTIFRLMWVENN